MDVHRLRSLGAGLLMTGVLLAAPADAAGARLAKAAPAEPECEFTLDQFEPRSAARTTFLGRDAVIFYEALLHRNQPVPEPPFDRVVLRSGRDVLGGTVVLIASGDCVLGHGFLSALDRIHATELVKLYADRASLQQSDHLDLEELRALADAGDPVAQLHVGLTLARGWGVPQDRGAGIGWLQRSADQGCAPGMLALGLARSGPGGLEDEAQSVGEPPRTDSFTDHVQACVWLLSAADSGDGPVTAAARHAWEWLELDSLMTREQRAECRRRLRSRK